MILIIIPCYNEEARIQKTLQKVRTFISDKPEMEVVVVNDGSDDETEKLFHSAVNRFPEKEKHRFHLLIHASNRGKGAAVQTAVQKFDAEAYCIVDADLSIGLEYFPKALHLLDTVDIVNGSRREFVVAGYSFFRRMISRLVRFFIHFLFGIKGDVQCGFKVFSRSARDVLLSIKQKRFSFDTEFLVRADQEGLRRSEIPVAWEHQTGSSVSFLDGVRYGLDLLLIAQDVRSKKWWYVWYAIVAFLGTGIFYGWFLTNGFFFSDDFTWIWHAKKIVEGPHTMLSARMSTFFSPVINALYVGLYQIAPFFAPVYFGIGIFVHMVNTFLVGVLSAHISRSRVVGFLSTVFFVTSGGAYEPIVWIAANMHSIVTFFILLSLILFLFSFDTLTARSRYLLQIGSFCFFLLALGTKETAVALYPILFLVSVVRIFKKRESIMRHLWFHVPALTIFFIYLWLQYQTQLQSVWVSSGSFDIGIYGFARFFVIFLDMIVPLGPVLNEWAGFFAFGISTVLLWYVITRFRSETGVWLGLAIVVFGTLPVLFFNSVSWWSILPSRYTYLPRVGLVMLAASILYSLIKEAKNVRFVSNLFWFICLTLILHTAVLFSHIHTEYNYVYQTGRSLLESAREIEGMDPDAVFVRSSRPFQNNYAHVVGVLDVVSGIEEHHVFFEEMTEESSQITGNVVSLQWDHVLRRYEVVQYE